MMTLASVTVPNSSNALRRELSSVAQARPPTKSLLPMCSFSHSRIRPSLLETDLTCFAGGRPALLRSPDGPFGHAGVLSLPAVVSPFPLCSREASPGLTQGHLIPAQSKRHDKAARLVQSALRSPRQPRWNRPLRATQCRREGGARCGSGRGSWGASARLRALRPRCTEPAPPWWGWS